MLVVGRNDKGEAVGVADARKLLEDLPNKIRDVLGIMADVHLVKKSKQELIEIRVEPYPTPISYKGSYYYRSGSTTQELKGAALEQVPAPQAGPHLGRRAGGRASASATYRSLRWTTSASWPDEAAGLNRPSCASRRRG